jgi:hypothetical protein
VEKLLFKDGGTEFAKRMGEKGVQFNWEETSSD